MRSLSLSLLKSSRERLYLVAALLLLVPLGDASADALVVTEAMGASTIAELFIEGETMRVELEIGNSDIPVFANLMPDEVYQRIGGDPEKINPLIPVDLVVDHSVQVDFFGSDGALIAFEIAPCIR